MSIYDTLFPNIKRILDSGKDSILPQAQKPVQFGVPNQFTTPVPIVPSTANTTRQTVTPTPTVQPQIKQLPDLQSRIPINPLDIIRRGKDQVIRQATDQEAIQALKTNPLKEALFGNVKDKAVLRDMQKRGIDPGFISTWSTEGFWSIMGRDKEEQKDRLYTDLKSKGIEGNRATEIAYFAIESKYNFKSIAEDLQNKDGGKRERAAKRLDELKLTSQEKVALGLQKVGQLAGSALEATDLFTFGTTKPIRKALSKKIGDKVAKIASDMTAEDATILRNMYRELPDGSIAKTIDKEDAVIRGMGIDKVPDMERRQAVEEILTAYDNRWAGVDEMLNPPAPVQRGGAMDIKPVAKQPLETLATPKVKSESVSSVKITPTNPKLEAFRSGKPNLEGGYINNPFADGKKKLSPIDTLIAENKVRVVSRDGRDVYQVKKGKEWKSVRDEDSAIKQSTFKKLSAEGIPMSTRGIEARMKKKVQLPNTLEEKLLRVDLAKQALNEDPAKQLARFVSKRGDFKGTLAEVTGTQKSKTGIGIDVRTQDLGYQSSEEARDAYNKYASRKAEISAEERAIKEEVKQYKATAKLKEKTVVAEKAVDRIREIQKVAPEQVRSLEEVSQQLSEVIDLPTRSKPVALDVIVAQTPVTKKVHLLDYIRTPDRVLNKIGFGKEAQLLRNQYEKYVIELPKNIDTISDWIKRVPKNSSQRIFDFLDGKAIKLSGEELKVAEEIRIYLKTWADRLGLPEDNRVTNYITHLFDAELIAKEFDEDLAKIIADKIPGEVYDPFLEKRLGAKGYKRDVWAALDAYTKRATRKVHIDPVLEKIKDRAGSSLEFTNLEETQFKYIQSYIERVQMRPTYIDKLIDNGVKSMFGYRFGQRPVVYVSRLLRQFTYRGMLGANLGSALRNLSQGINTYATLGEKYTAIGYAKMLNTNARAELAREGVLAQNFIEDRVLSSTKQVIQKADKALWFFFDQAEKINRGAAYFGAKAKGINLGMSEEKAIEYAKSIVRKTQFAYDNVDAPVFMGTDLVKTLAQFQTFTVKQTEFLIEMAKDKNFAGLIRYAIGGYIFVNTVGKAMGMKEEELLPTLRFDTPPSLKFPVEVAKALANTPDNYGNIPTTEKKLSNIGKSFLGLVPGGMQAKKTVEGLKSVEEGGVYDAAGRLKFLQGQSTPEKIQSVLFGKYSSEASSNYFNKKDDKKKSFKEIKSTYDQFQKLKAEGKDEEGQSLIDSLTDEQYELYKEYKSQVKSENKAQLKKDMLTVYLKNQKLKKEGKTEEVQASVDAMTEEEYDAYTAVKKDANLLETEANKRSTVETVGAYAKAFVIDPGNAWKALTTREQLGKVEGNLVEMKRFYGEDYKATNGSEAYIYEQLKKMNIPTSERSNYNLEHIVPVSAGGDSSPSNLKIVTRKVHDSYTAFDTALGKRVKSGEITRKEAEKLAKEYKGSN